jgi:hypothetical protein
MNYKIINNSDNLFNVIETATSQIIKSFEDQKEAKDYMRFLNLGGAFDGFTPSFLAKKLKPLEKSQ